MYLIQFALYCCRQFHVRAKCCLYLNRKPSQHSHGLTNGDLKNAYISSNL